MSDATEPKQASAKQTEAHPLDALTGGAFSAATSGERGARIREWLSGNPSQEQLQEVFNELSARDKGVARLVRERLDELRRAQNQELISQEWEEKARVLLAAVSLSVQEAQAWQRDAAKAGAALSREPLAGLKAQLADRVRAIEALQHRMQVQRETAVLLAQRIEVLSTKSWRDAQSAMETLQADVDRWHAEAAELQADLHWESVDPKLPPLFDASRQQLTLVWEAFQAALQMTVQAAEDAEALLPSVPVWADELRVARGLPAETAVVSQAAPAGAAKAPRSGRQDPAAVAEAERLVTASLDAVRAQTGTGDAAALAQAIAALRALLKQYGRYVSEGLEHQIHTALIEAGESQGWQRRQADKVREELVQKAEALLNRPDGQALGGRRIQESLRQLREQWKQADQSSPPNHALWKKFDEACNAAHKVVEAWLEKVRAESAQNRAQRLALIDELQTWAQEAAQRQDWKGMLRGLQQFSDRWRNAGHLSEKAYTELQAQWKQAIAQASAALEAVQKESLARRQAMIEEAAQLAAVTPLRIDAVKALQGRWQAEAQSVPMDRRQEQKLWDAFRQPLDEAFERKGSERSQRPGAAPLSAHDKAVMEAAQQLEAVVAVGDASEIRKAMAALEEVVRQQPPASAEVQSEAAAPAAASAEETASKPVVASRPVVAVRGDDRPGARQQAAAPVVKHARSGDRKFPEKRQIPERALRGPRLGDAAFRAQRDAQERAQYALRKLAAKAHGESLSRLLDAWSKRDVQALPSAQELGQKLPSNARAAWGRALETSPKMDAAESLLRLEIAADVPTPAAQLSARRMLQLQLLTKRNAAAPQETWVEDVAAVLASSHEEENARRLQNALKALIK